MSRTHIFIVAVILGLLGTHGDLSNLAWGRDSPWAGRTTRRGLGRWTPWRFAFWELNVIPALLGGTRRCRFEILKMVELKRRTGGGGARRGWGADPSDGAKK
jgi:hypothetical protein